MTRECNLNVKAVGYLKRSEVGGGGIRGGNCIIFPAPPFEAHKIRLVYLFHTTPKCFATFKNVTKVDSLLMRIYHASRYLLISSPHYFIKISRRKGLDGN